MIALKSVPHSPEILCLFPFQMFSPFRWMYENVTTQLNLLSDPSELIVELISLDPQETADDRYRDRKCNDD